MDSSINNTCCQCGTVDYPPADPFVEPIREQFVDLNIPEHVQYQPLIVTDEYLLNYLLNRYHLNKQKLIQMIQKVDENKFKTLVLKDFYQDCPQIPSKPFKEQYQLFKKWNHCGVQITKEELKDYHSQHFSPIL